VHGRRTEKRYGNDDEYRDLLPHGDSFQSCSLVEKVQPGIPPYWKRGNFRENDSAVRIFPGDFRVLQLQRLQNN
jgi:hypothetical protein